MNAILDFLEFVIQAVLTLMLWVVILYAIVSWLIAFDVINLRNRFVSQASRLLDSLARPILRPFQRVLPAMGGMDLSPILLFIVIGGVQRYLIPPFFAWLHSLVGAPVVV